MCVGDLFCFCNMIIDMQDELYFIFIFWSRFYFILFCLLVLVMNCLWIYAFFLPDHVIVSGLGWVGLVGKLTHMKNLITLVQ